MFRRPLLFPALANKGAMPVMARARSEEEEDLPSQYVQSLLGGVARIDGKQYGPYT